MGEAKRRKQKDSDFGKKDFRLTNLCPSKEATNIYDNPNVLVGIDGSPSLNQSQTSEDSALKLSGTIRRQIRESAASWQVWHQNSKKTPNGRSIVIVNPPNKTPPVLIHHFSDRKYFWQLQENAEQWRFEPNIPVHLIETPPPEKWKVAEILTDMRHWPAIPYYNKRSKKEDYQKLRAFIGSHYRSLCLWLEWQNGRNDLEDLVLRTPLCHVRPYYDLSVALKEFCFQVWSKDVPMALRATSKEHLWYCAEYSLMLGKVKDTNLTGNNYLGWGKDKTSKFGGRVIARRKEILRLIKAHNQNPFLIADVESLNLLSIESLHSQGFDWREWIVWLLIDDAIRHAFDSGDETLTHYCNQFLSSYNHYIRLLSGQDVDDEIDPNVHVCMYLNERDEYVISQQHRTPARPLMPFEG